MEELRKVKEKIIGKKVCADCFQAYEGEHCEVCERDAFKEIQNER